MNEKYKREAVVGFFAKPGTSNRTKIHIVSGATGKPLCGLKPVGEFQWVGPLSISAQHVDCKSCEKMKNR